MRPPCPPLPTIKDIPGTVHHDGQHRFSLYFCPATSQSALDIPVYKLDQDWPEAGGQVPGVGGGPEDGGGEGDKNKCTEIIFSPGIVLFEALRRGGEDCKYSWTCWGSECGLGHTFGQGGQVEACLEMVEKISKLLATRGISFPIESPQSGQLAMARFIEY